MLIPYHLKLGNKKGSWGAEKEKRIQHNDRNDYLQVDDDSTAPY